jgi:hypothetical protein
MAVLVLTVLILSLALALPASLELDAKLRPPTPTPTPVSMLLLLPLPRLFSLCCSVLSLPFFSCKKRLRILYPRSLFLYRFSFLGFNSFLACKLPAWFLIAISLIEICPLALF